MTDQVVFAPCSLKQQLVLTDTTTDVLLVGGGAGGGKTRCCLTKYLPEVGDKNFMGIIFRKSQPELKVAGGIVDESKKIYPHLKGKYKIQEMKWEFPGGGFIQFRGLPDDITSLQGMQATNILVDEAAEWKEEDILFLLSRMRSGSYQGKRQCVLTCNPSRDSFLYNWVEWCLDENGVPKAGTENVIRWFVNLDGKIYWADSKEELVEKHGQGYVVGENFIPKSFRFIPMMIYDNPILLKNDPSYLASLLAQPKVNQLRYLHGSWTARPEAAGYFKREWCEVLYQRPIAAKRVRAWDLAGTLPSEANRDPDWSVGVLMSRDRFGRYCIEDVVRFRDRPAGVLETILKTAEADGADVDIVIPADPNAAGQAYAQGIVRELSEKGFYCRIFKTNISKLTRFAPFAAVAEAKLVSYIKADWNEEYLTELENFDGDRKKKDDQADATSDAFKHLARTAQFPQNFSLPNLTRANPFNT